MKTYTIYTAKSRFDKVLERKEVSWEQLIKGLSNTKRTAETQEEYFSFDKDKQDKIKDVGGFTGSILKNGSRKKANVLEKTLITLDIDNTTADIIDKIKQAYKEYDYIIYSTHKHKPDKPRIRLLFPLDRNATPLEYEATARYIANMIGINEFDPSTFEPSRFMYFPSTSKDAEYLFLTNSGKQVNVNEILNNYKDYKDTTSWSYHKEEKTTKHTNATVQDPISKKGIIGDFCRIYTISKAIETFLSDTYIKESETRYTYVNGSTSSGLVIYDEDRFATSNHSTDPICGLNVNAYDLVRMHLYPDNENAFKDFIKRDKRYIAYKLMQKHNIKDKHFIEWFSLLELDKFNQVKPSRENIHIILKNDKYLNNVGRYNQFNERFEKYQFEWLNNTNSKDFSENDYLKVIEHFESQYGITAKATIRETIYSFMCNYTYHPVKDYLNALPKWDNIPRIETIFCKLFGVEDNEYTRVISKKWFLAGITRIFEPGCKFDYMIVISGSEGIGKSTFAAKLAHNEEWFTDDLGVIGEKDSFERINGIWIAEYAELKDIRKISVETLKSFVSKQRDIYRAAYAKEKTEHKRQCIFLGTTNECNFLRGADGNRRFWILEARKNFQEIHPAKLTNKDIDSLWSEAMHYYTTQTADERSNLNFVAPEIEELAEKQRQEFYELNPYQDEVATYVETLVPKSFETWNTGLKHRYYSCTNESERYELLKELLKTKEPLVNRTYYTAIQFWKEFKGMWNENNKLNKMQTMQINAALKNCENDKLVYNKIYRPRIKIENITHQPKGCLMAKEPVVDLQTDLLTLSEKNDDGLPF